MLQEMLSYLNIKNKTITADAMHCQRDTCARIIGQKGDYILELKGNQGTLLEDVKLFLQENNDKTEIDEYTTLKKITVA